MANQPCLTFPVWKEREFIPSKTRCLVIMPFEIPTLERVYKEVVDPEVRKVRLDPERASEWTAPEIMEDIWTSMNTARLVIAETTFHKPNVWYELGIAHTLGKPTIIMSSEPAEKIPFDVRHRRHLLYRQSVKGRRDLAQKLGHALQEIVDEHRTGHRLLDELESNAEDWRGPTRDSGILYDPSRLNLIRKFLRPSDLSDSAVAFCLASACQWGSALHMRHWGVVCDQRLGAAEDLIFVLFDPQRRPRLRVAYVLSQLSQTVRERILARMAEHGVDRSIREAIRRQVLPAYVRSRYAAGGLSAGERDELLDLFGQVILRVSPAGKVTSSR